MTKVIVVEDDDLDVERIERQLRKLGADDLLIRARDGREALDLLTVPPGTFFVPPPFVMVVDLNMPRMNGFELIDHLQTVPGFDQVPVFVCTTSDHPRDIQDATDRGVCGYIVKPIRADQVGAIVERARSYEV